MPPAPAAVRAAQGQVTPAAACRVRDRGGTRRDSSVPAGRAGARRRVRARNRRRAAGTARVRPAWCGSRASRSRAAGLRAAGRRAALPGPGRRRLRAGSVRGQAAAGRGGQAGFGQAAGFAGAALWRRGRAASLRPGQRGAGQQHASTERAVPSTSRRPGSSGSLRATPDRGRPPGPPDQGQGWAPGAAHPGANPRNTGSWQAAGPASGQAWASGTGTPRRGSGNTGSRGGRRGSGLDTRPGISRREPGEHRIVAGRPWTARSRHADGGRLAGCGQETAQGLRAFAQGIRGGRATLAPGRRPEPSRLRAGRRGRDTAAGHRLLAGRGTRPGTRLDPPGHKARASTVREQGTRAPGRPRAGRQEPGGPVRDSSRTPVSRTRASPIRGHRTLACATPAASAGQAARSSGSVTAHCPTRRQARRRPVAAIENDNVAAFARDLRVLRSKAGLDYPDMAEKSHYTMRTLASAAGGLRLPTLPVLIAYVNACDGDVTEWEERWGRLTKSGKRTGQVALLAGGQDQASPRATGRFRRARGRPARSTSSPRPGSATNAGSRRVRGGHAPRKYNGRVLPADNHVHTEWSYDTSADASMVRSCEQAVAVGLPAIAFTEHLEFISGGPGDAIVECRHRPPLVEQDQATRRRGVPGVHRGMPGALSRPADPVGRGGG